MNRGGARVGSGRKPVDISVKKIQVTITLTPDQLSSIRTIADKEGVGQSIMMARVIDAGLRQMTADYWADFYDDTPF